MSRSRLFKLSFSSFIIHPTTAVSCRFHLPISPTSSPATPPQQPSRAAAARQLVPTPLQLGPKIPTLLLPPQLLPKHISPTPSSTGEPLLGRRPSQTPQRGVTIPPRHPASYNRLPPPRLTITPYGSSSSSRSRLIPISPRGRRRLQLDPGFGLPNLLPAALAHHIPPPLPSRGPDPSHSPRQSSSPADSTARPAHHEHRKRQHTRQSDLQRWTGRRTRLDRRRGRFGTDEDGWAGVPSTSPPAGGEGRDAQGDVDAGGAQAGRRGVEGGGDGPLVETPCGGEEGGGEGFVWGGGGRGGGVEADDAEGGVGGEEGGVPCYCLRARG